MGATGYGLQIAKRRTIRRMHPPDQSGQVESKAKLKIKKTKRAKRKADTGRFSNLKFIYHAHYWNC